MFFESIRKMVEEREQKIKRVRTYLYQNKLFIVYTYEGHIRTISCENSKEVGDFLKQQRLIEYYYATPDNIRLYIKGNYDDNYKDVEVSIEEIINPSVALTLAAINELPIKGIVTWPLLKSKFNRLACVG